MPEEIVVVYGLLLGRRGPFEANTGVFRHSLHHLARIAAVPAGDLLPLLDGLRRGR